MQSPPKAIARFPESRHRALMTLIRQERQLSRWELHQRTGVNPNAVGRDVGELLAMQIVRESKRESTKPGRPQIPLEIDGVSRNVVGLAITPHQVQVGKLNLYGQPLGKLAAIDIKSPEEMVPAARKLLSAALSDRTLGVGVSAAGFLDPARQSILFNLYVRGAQAMNVEGIFDIIGERPVVVFENDLHALAARWVLTHEIESSEDVLLVYMDDATMGAAVLVQGVPNRGCLIGANELGHMRYFVETEKCYCGHTGCLEKIYSSEFLARGGGPGKGDLASRIAKYDGTDPAVERVIDYVSNGLANAVNFIRPNRLVLVSEFTRHAAFNDAMDRAIRSRILSEISKRVKLDAWDQPNALSAETSGWLALAGLYREGWNQPPGSALAAQRTLETAPSSESDASATVGSQ